MPRSICASPSGPLISVAAPAAGQPDLKVAIVYDIIRFTRFVPPPPGGDVVLCAIGSPPLLDAFARIDGAAVPDGRLALRALARPSEVRGDCTIVCSQTTADSAHFGSAAMTIGEAPDFAGRGGTAGLRNWRDRARPGDHRGVRRDDGWCDPRRRHAGYRILLHHHAAAPAARRASVPTPIIEDDIMKPKTRNAVPIRCGP